MIVQIGFVKTEIIENDFIIYESQNKYSSHMKCLLEEYYL
jgi:hypothetical protein